MVKKTWSIVLVILLLVGLCTTSFAYGERTEPYSAYTARTFTFQPYSFEAKKTITLTLLDLKVGAEANTIIQNEWSYNTDPASDEQWLFFEFKLKYVAGPEEELSAYEIISPYYGLTNQSGVSITPQDTALFDNEYAGMDVYNISLWPGTESKCYLGVLVKKSVGYPLLKIKNTPDAYLWFNTDPKYPRVSSASYNSIVLTWQAVPNASKYELYYSTSKTGTYNKLATTTSTAYTKTGLTTGKTYYFKVRYYNSSGSASSFSLSASGKPVPSAPTAVKAVSASFTSNKISWKAVSGATKYEVYLATSSKGTYSLISPTSSTSYTNTALTTGKTYYYKVRAYHLEGGKKIFSGYSSVASVKPVPAAPASVKATRASSTSIKVSWGTVSGATKYEVYCCTTSNGSYTKAATVSSAYFTKTGLKTGKTYYFKVRAYHLEGSIKVFGIFSPVVHATT